VAGEKVRDGARAVSPEPVQKFGVAGRVVRHPTGRGSSPEDCGAGAPAVSGAGTVTGAPRRQQT
jgi:hypothetical protein